jgi:Concanavalin A-like lectin/glucanases superfamily
MKRLIFAKVLLLLFIPTVSYGVTGWTGSEWEQELTTEITSQAEFVYHFNESAGATTTDASGNGHTGTVQNAALWQTGKFGNALYFDGQSWTAGTDIDGTYVDVADTFDPWPTEMTLMAWVKLDVSNRRNNIITSKGSFELNKVWSGELEGFIQDNASNWTSGATSVPQSIWVHVAMTYKGDLGDSTSEVRYYINGALDDVVTWAPDYGHVAGDTTGYAVRVGDNGFDKAANSWARDRQFQGAMDDVAVFYEVLNFTPADTEPGGGMAAGPDWIQGYPPSGELLYHFDESSGTVAYDSSGNGNDGAISDADGVEWMTGKYNNALFFDGNRDNNWLDATKVILTDLDAVHGWQELTGEAWIKVDPDDTNRHLDVFSMRSYLYIHRQAADGVYTITALVFDSVNRYVYGTTIVDPSDGWTHVAVTYKAIDNGDATYGGRVRLYVNGKLDGENAWATGGNGGFWPPNRTLYVGASDPDLSWAVGRKFRGLIDEVRIINQEIEFTPFPATVGIVPLPNAGLKIFGASDGWDQLVLWQDDEINHPGEIGCKIHDGTTQYTITEAESAGLISGTIYGFDNAAQAYQSIPGSGGDYIDANTGYVIWTSQPNLNLLIPVE